MNNLQPPQDPSASWASRYNEDRDSQFMIETRRANAEPNLPVPPRCSGGSLHSANVNSYYLDRGDGQYTRLLPADMLPPMNNVSRRETRHDNMVILPPLPVNPGQERGYRHAAQHGEPATRPSTASRQRIFCDKWIHEGVCAFTQRGYRFKHEMPSDTATQRSLGLFHRRGMADGNLHGALTDRLVGRPGETEW